MMNMRQLYDVARQWANALKLVFTDSVERAVEQERQAISIITRVATDIP